VAGAYVQALLALGSYSEARAYAEHTLAECDRLDLRAIDDVVRGLAFAEAKLGDHAAARQRLETLIERQRELGVSGLHLGASYEARARVAIAAGDRDTLIEYSRLAAQEYRHGRGSSLGARYEQLMGEAQRSGIEAPPQWSEFESTMLGPSRLTSASAVRALVSATLRAADSTAQRAESALRLLCETAAANGGYLYLVQPDGGVSCAAARDAALPGAAELLHARDCLEWALNQDIGNTAHTSAGGPSGPSSSLTLWTSAAGIQQRAVLLTSSDPRDPRHVAVAILIGAREREALPPNHPLLAILGEHLLDAGDTAGVAAS
jgi:tetratricopeptide (TPR) repeat protein